MPTTCLALTSTAAATNFTRGILAHVSQSRPPHTYVVGAPPPQGDEETTAEQRELIEEVRFQVGNLADLIKTYQSRNKLSKVLLATSFKRRQEDLEAAIDRTLDRLQVSHVMCGTGLYFSAG